MQNSSINQINYTRSGINPYLPEQAPRNLDTTLSLFVYDPEKARDYLLNWGKQSPPKIRHLQTQTAHNPSNDNLDFTAERIQELTDSQNDNLDFTAERIQELIDKQLDAISKLRKVAPHLYNLPMPSLYGTADFYNFTYPSFNLRKSDSTFYSDTQFRVRIPPKPEKPGTVDKEIKVLDCGVLRSRGLYNSYDYKEKKLDKVIFSERVFEISSKAPDEESRTLLANGTLWPFEKFMDEALYNEKFGYYSAGKVQFGQGGHFTTYSGPYLAVQILTQAFVMYKCMREAGDISEGEKFVIREFGAGEGKLAHGMLNNLDSCFANREDPICAEFLQALRYEIVEISPALIKRQQKTNQIFLEKEVLTIQQGDARNFTSDLPPIKGLVVSNELIDAFPLSAVRLHEGNLEVLTLRPLISAEETEGKLNKVERATFTHKDKTFVALFPDELKHFDMTTLHWKHHYVSVDLFPKIKKFITKFGIPYKETLLEGKVVLLNREAAQFTNRVSTSLTKGFVITIDYGLTPSYRQNPALHLFGPKGLVSFSDERHPLQDFCTGIGVCDITTNVDFKVMVEAGKESGLQPLSLLRQDDLSDVMPDLPFNSLYLKSFYGHRDARGFYALIQQKQGTGASYCVPSDSFLQDTTNEARLLGRTLFHFFQKSNSHSYADFKLFYTKFNRSLSSADLKIIKFLLTVNTLTLESAIFSLAKLSMEERYFAREALLAYWSLAKLRNNTSSEEKVV